MKIMHVPGSSSIATSLVLLTAAVAQTREPIFPVGAWLKVEAENGSGGEGPVWHPKLGVLSSGNGHIYRLDRDGKSSIYREKAGTNGLLFDQGGRLLACEAERRQVTRTELDGTITILSERYQAQRYNQPNDLTVDSQGRIYFSDPRYGNRDGMEILDEEGRTVEGVYRIDADGSVTRVIGRELERPNGVLVSVDDRFLFVADNNNDTIGGARKLWRIGLRADGTVDLDDRKLLHDWGAGRGPDGMKQDQEGRLYVAAGLNQPNPPFEPAEDKKGGIYVFDVEGELLDFLQVPSDEVTNCAFGGDDLTTLYITAGGTLYSIRTSTPGNARPPVLHGVKAKADEGQDPDKNGKAGGDADDEGNKPFPLHKRWEIRFPKGFTVNEYAKWLDFFEIELGVLSANEVTYLSHLAQEKPDTRRGKSKDDFRLYLTWRSGDMKKADAELLKRAGVPPARHVLQFYPDKLEKALLQLEHDYRDRAAEAIAKTRFGIRNTDDGFEFYVIEQTAR